MSPHDPEWPVATGSYREAQFSAVATGACSSEEVVHKRGTESPTPLAYAIAASWCFCTPSIIICFAFAASPQPMILAHLLGSRSL